MYIWIIEVWENKTKQAKKEKNIFSVLCVRRRIFLKIPIWRVLQAYDADQQEANW